MSSTTTIAYLAANWLDTTDRAVTTTSTAWPHYEWSSPTCTWYSVPTKIRLKLSEVERLRPAAKEDKKLKEVLQKFAAHIEIEVDFE